MTFVRNAWYAASWASELAHTLKHQTILGEDVVLYRTLGGRPAALRDRCPHRLLPLSHGRLVEDSVQCGYHGLVFDQSGTCVHVPGQVVIPPNARVKSYPVAERLGLIWIWMGDPAKADTAQIYNLSEYHQPEWGAEASRTVDAGATLVCCIGATIGKIGKSTVRSAFKQQINAVEWGERMHAEYGCAVMRFFKPTIIAWGSSTTLPILKKSSFERIEIPVPPVADQQEFALRIERVGRVRATHRVALSTSNELFSGHCQVN